MKLISFLPLLFISTLLSAQKKTDLTIHFDSDKANIRPSDARLLDSLVATFPHANNIKIEITGHCDSRGTNGYNDTLSLKRVRSVKKYLLARGVNLSLISKEEGYGETMPVADFPTRRGQWENRRVELTITEDNNLPAENTLTKLIGDTITKAGTIITMQNLNFEGGMHRLLPGSMPVLQDLLNALQKNENLAIRIEGHICCMPDASDGYDLETTTNNLSEERARAVYFFLIKNHIKPERLSFIGFGHQKPIYSYPERSEQERIANRRVEIRIMKK